MAMHTPQEPDWERLERLYQLSPSESVGQQFRRFFADIWKALTASFNTHQNQPRIRKYFNSRGLPIWHVYDPVSKASFTSTSEYKILTWLDQHR